MSINQQWVFSQGAGLDFGTATATSPPTLTTGFGINTFEGCASVSDANGSLLFYTDGIRIWDANHVVRSSALVGNPSSTQSSIIVPDPGSPDRYYVFTTAGLPTGTSVHFNGVRVDLTNWSVTPIDPACISLPTTAGMSATEKLTAVQHANCRDYWVITLLQTAAPGATQARGPGMFRVFLVTPLGVQHWGDTPIPQTIEDAGYLRASPTGNRLAMANVTPTATVMYCDFDNTTGTVATNTMTTIPTTFAGIPPNHPHDPYGVEFSPNGSLLYYTLLGLSSGTTTASNGYVFQYEFASQNAMEVAMHPNNAAMPQRYALGALQRGIDGRIYIAKDGEMGLGAILAPDVIGTACSVNLTYIALPTGTRCFLGLPNLLPNPCTAECACESECQGEVDNANAVLNDRAGRKEFVLVANGQALPTTCDAAFDPRPFAPVFTLHWGDGPTDQFESHDTEIIYIRAHNPFRNISYSGLKIFNIQITPNQVLPDGTAALKLVPAETVCYEGVQSCSFVSRDFAFLIDNAAVGTYQISFDFCIDEIRIVAVGDGAVEFDVDVVAS